MKARIIKQAGWNGSLYWALSIKSSDGSRHILKLDQSDYRNLNNEDLMDRVRSMSVNASDLPCPEDLDPLVKEFFGKIAERINARNELLDLVRGSGWVRQSKGNNV
jgi:hypothetical protein